MYSCSCTQRRQPTPALLIKTFNFPPLILKNSFAPSLTESNESNSILTKWISTFASPPSAFKISPMTSLVFASSRPVTKTVAPVSCNALAVSIPSPLEHPVMRMTLPDNLPSRPSSLTIWMAVGRASLGPLRLEVRCAEW
jgi:hypothetical protein